MMSTIALVVASVTACGTIAREVNTCLNIVEPRSTMQQVVNQTPSERPLEDFIHRQMDNDNDTEIGIKINVSHTIPRDERE